MIREDVGVFYSFPQKSVTFGDLQITTDEFIDVLIGACTVMRVRVRPEYSSDSASSGTRKYIPCLCEHFLSVMEGLDFLPTFEDVYNKIDSVSLEQVDKVAREPHTGIACLTRYFPY